MAHEDIFNRTKLAMCPTINYLKLFYEHHLVQYGCYMCGAQGKGVWVP